MPRPGSSPGLGISRAVATTGHEAASTACDDSQDRSRSLLVLASGQIFNLIPASGQIFNLKRLALQQARGIALRQACRFADEEALEARHPVNETEAEIADQAQRQ